LANRFDPPTGSLGRGFAKGAFYTALSQAVRIGVQFASVLILARMLSPDDFGVMAMASPIFGFVALFSDLGINQATIQRAQLSVNQASVLFWISVIAALALSILLIALSPFVTEFYHDKRAGAVCAMSGFALVATGLGTQHLALLARTLRFKALAFNDACSAIVGLLGSIVAAALGASYWALVIGGFLAALAPTLCAFIQLPWVPGIPRKDAEFRSIFGFGANVTTFNIANYISRNFDNVLIGRRWGAGQLGLYDRAYKLLLMPLTQITGPVSKVIVPTLSRLIPNPDGYRYAYEIVISQLLLLAVPGVVVLISTADSLIPILMGQQWRGVVPIFLVLGFAGLIQPLNNSAGWLLITQSRTRLFAYWGLFGSLLNVAAFVIGLPYGAFGVALAYTICEYLRTPLLWWCICRRGPVGLQSILCIISPCIVGTLLALLASFAFKRYVWASFPVQILGTISVSYSAFLIVYWVDKFSRRSIVRSLEMIKELAKFK
jgi:polysaccharide transporter, PST family